MHILHDAHIIHDVQRAGWHAAGMTPIVTDVDKRATALNHELFAKYFEDPPRPPRRAAAHKARGRSKARGRALRRRKERRG